MPAAASISMAASSASTPSSNVVPASGLHTQQNYADQLLFPIPDSLRVIPWLPNTASVVCLGYWYDGEPLRAAPRFVFAELLERAGELGYDVILGHEYEYYLLDAATKQRLYEGIHIFHTVRNHYTPFLDTLVPTLRAYGIDIITHNCEYAGSQYETNYGPGRNLAGVDKAFAFKNGMKELAHRSGLIASFMAKPFAGLSGSGCHLHISLADKEDRQERLQRPARRRTGFPPSAPPSPKASSRMRRR